MVFVLGVLPTFLRARAYHLLRTVDLGQGQMNILVVHLDGVRTKRTSYGY